MNGIRLDLDDLYDDMITPSRSPLLSMNVACSRQEAFKLINQAGREFVLRGVDFDSAMESATLEFDVYQGPYIVERPVYADAKTRVFLVGVSLLIGISVGYYLSGAWL